jgi:glucokinase
VAAIDREAVLLTRTASRTRAGEGPLEVIGDLVNDVAAARRRVGDDRLVGIGLSAPGPVDPSAGVVLQAPNLRGWDNVPLADELRRRTGLPVWLGNDANLAALGEARFGAGRGSRNLIYLTISTGVGGGVIADGRLLLGSRGLAAEVGHMAISMDGPRCGCGNRGCLEAYASGTGLVNRAREAIAEGRASSLAVEDGPLTPAGIAETAEHGDPLAQELLSAAGCALGVGIRSLLHLFNPSVIVIGGGVSQVGPRLWDPMLEVVRGDAMSAYREGLRIIPSELGDDSGLVGAAVLAFDAVDGSP